MSGLYLKGREKFLRGEVAWLTDSIKVVLVPATYTANLTTHEFLSDIPLGSRVAISDELASKTTTDAWASTERIEWQSVDGQVCTGMVVFKDTGLITTSPLLAYLNDGVSNLPLDPTGVKVTFFPDPSTGLFRL